jgi:hypothetical protein
MRQSLFPITAFAAAAVLLAGALTPVHAQQPKSGQTPTPQQKGAPPPQAAPAPAPAPQQPPADQSAAPPSPPMPYKPVAIQLPQPVKDPTFEAFRKQITALAQKKDRAGLARVVSNNFFWMQQDTDGADKKKPGIENLSKAIGLEGKDAQGWEALAAFAADPTAEPDPQHKGAICAPADPVFDDKAAEELANATQTDSNEWGYPLANGLEVRSAPQASAPVTEKLGLHLVRVYPDESAANAVSPDFLRIVTPSGKLGYIAADQLSPLGGDQICYIKEGNTWKITGVLSGG